MLDVRMKIVAGLGSVDEYIRFCKAGADEFFAGYVPYEWNKKYGTVLPLRFFAAMYSLAPFLSWKSWQE